MLQDYDGSRVVDPDGNVIGTVERTYDDQVGVARYIEIKIGSLLAKHRLVPLENVQFDDNTLTVPYTKAIIEDGPDASSLKETLDGDTLQAAADYYDTLRSAAIPSRKAPAGRRDTAADES